MAEDLAGSIYLLSFAVMITIFIVLLVMIIPWMLNRVCGDDDDDDDDDHHHCYCY